MVSTDAAHIYIIPQTGISLPVFDNRDKVRPCNAQYCCKDMLDCSLYSASYTAFFNFSYPLQNIDIRSRTLLNPVHASVEIQQWMNLDSPDIVKQQAQRICYQSIMESFGKLLIGFTVLMYVYTFTTATKWNMLSIDWTSRDTAQKGLEELFQNITLSILSNSLLT